MKLWISRLHYMHLTIVRYQRSYMNIEILWKVALFTNRCHFNHETGSYHFRNLLCNEIKETEVDKMRDGNYFWNRWTTFYRVTETVLTENNIRLKKRENNPIKSWKSSRGKYTTIYLNNKWSDMEMSKQTTRSAVPQKVKIFNIARGIVTYIDAVTKKRKIFY